MEREGGENCPNSHDKIYECSLSYREGVRYRRGHRKFAWRHSWMLPNSVPVLSQDQNPDCQNPKPRTRIQNPEPEYFAKNRSHSLSFTCPVVANLSLDGELIRAGERLSRHKPNSKNKTCFIKNWKKNRNYRIRHAKRGSSWSREPKREHRNDLLSERRNGGGWSDLWFGAERL